jgi:crossover junction endodeoxyribonuclease RuvC
MILGIDPGIKTTGYGLIEVENKDMKMVDYGTINTSTQSDFAVRLKKIYDGVIEIIGKYHPAEMAIEEAFYHKNVRTAMILGHARAAAILASVNSSVEVSEYSPLKIKQAVVGTGSASKEQVQFMVKTILNLDEKPTPNDAADGLAVAICHINRSRFQNALKIR